MRVLVVGGGAREHALCASLAASPSVEEVWAAPGNPGIEELATCRPVPISDLEGLAALVEEEGFDLTVVGPEAPLVAGLGDALRDAGHPVFGPSSDGARLEGSKAWASELCERHAIPAARAESFDAIGPALAFLDDLGPPFVVKVDGLAAGKGVTIAPDRAVARAALEASLEGGAFGEAGARVVIQEHLGRRGGLGLGRHRRQGRPPAPARPGLQAGPRRGPGPEHRRHGGVLPAPRPRRAHREGHRAGRPAGHRRRAPSRGRRLPGRRVRRPHADRGRPEGPRVQLPVRGPRGPGDPATPPFRPGRGPAGLRRGATSGKRAWRGTSAPASPSCSPREATRAPSRPGSPSMDCPTRGPMRGRVATSGCSTRAPNGARVEWSPPAGACSP